MDTLREFSRGLQLHGEAINFMRKHKMMWWFIFPLLINLILLFSLGELITQLSNYIQTLIFESISIQDTESQAWWAQLVRGIVWFGFKIVSYLVLIYLAGSIVLILMSPFMALLSEKVAEKMEGKIFPFKPLQFLKDILRSLLISLRNLFIELTSIALIFILGTFFPLAWIGPLILFVVSAYFYGFSFMDYSNERNQMGIKESLNLIKAHKGMALGIGFYFSLVLLIPILGKFIASFICIISTVAATLAAQELRTKVTIAE